MNQRLLKQYISAYKEQFQKISRQEIYKWKAVKRFQEVFQLESKDISKTLNESFSESVNLLASTNYLPWKMLVTYAEHSPELVRIAFQNLFDEDIDLIARMKNFRQTFEAFKQEKDFEGLNHYQDHRAMMVYLTLRYPERYYFYKFGMLKSTAGKLGYPYHPIRGRYENIGQYLNLCELVRNEIQKDQELIALHESRLDDTCYRDQQLHILTQDVVYAIAVHLDNISEEDTKEMVIDAEGMSIASNFQIAQSQEKFQAKMINHLQNGIDNKKLGDKGEMWVMEYERRRLDDLGLFHLAEKVKHTAKEQGDGTGYDIESFDETGTKIFIEVKTTTGPFNKTFFITRTELKRSVQEGLQYRLYRLYDFDDKKLTAKLKVIKGDLSHLCGVPVGFEVNIKSGDNG